MEQYQIEKSTKEDLHILSATAVFLMLICNLFGYPERLGVTFKSVLSLGSVPIESPLARFGEIHIILFAFIIGYNTYSLCRGKDPHAMFEVLSQGIRALYQKLWIVFVAFLPLCIIRHVSRVTLDFAGFFWNLTGMQPFYNGEWWFFAPLILILFFYPILYNLSERFYSPASELIAVILFNGFCRDLLPFLMEHMWIPAFKGSFAYEKTLEVAMLLPSFWMGCVFSKYGFLSAIKQRLSGNYIYSIGAAIFAVISIPLRMYLGSEFDCLMVPLYGASILVALNGNCCSKIRSILTYIGKESIFIWLTHSMFCYELCQSVIYAPKYSVLVLVWLLVICLITAKSLRIGMRIIARIWNPLREWFLFENTRTSNKRR